MSRAHLVDLDRLDDRINLDPMIQIKYVYTTHLLGDILTKESFTGDRWTHLTLLVKIMTHTTFTQSYVSVSSAFGNPFFSSMSEHAGESVATSASAKQKQVHCTAMIARKMNDKNADMDYHAVPPPDNKAGGDSTREELCEEDSERVTRTAGGSSSGQQVAAEDPSSEKKIPLHPNADGEIHQEV